MDDCIFDVHAIAKARDMDSSSTRVGPGRSDAYFISSATGSLVEASIYSIIPGRNK